jgi:outer membrane receptor protein involved in Fe transport
VGRWWVINSSVSYAFGSRVNVRLVVNNVFDKLPPYPALSGAGGNFAAATSYYYAGIIGRTYQLSIDAYLF